MSARFEFEGRAQLMALSLESKGMTPVGMVYQDRKTGKRATLDQLGHIQYWDVDVNGGMRAPQVTSQTQGRSDGNQEG